MITHDFYFGDSLKNSSIDLSTLVKLANQSNKQAFNTALNRVLRDNTNHTVRATCGTSFPDFIGLLKVIDTDTVSRVVIGARTDRNQSVKSTLDCKLYLPEGILHIVPHWCAYKELRAEEVVNTLVKPLTWNGLLKHTFISDNEKDSWHNQKAISQDLNEAIAELFALNGYPEYSDSDINKMVG